MAGDWIKMRSDLLTHPKIVRMMSALKADKFRVIGGLHAVWCLFDMHSEDGQLDGYTPEVLDSYLGWVGFSDAMISIDWLEKGEGESLIAPRFEEHNGQSAKRRAQESSRKKEARKTSADDADKKRTREEKRREEKKDTTKQTRGTRLPATLELSSDWGNEALQARVDWVNTDVVEEFASFKDYWVAQPGQKGVKLDWLATWRNWCRNSYRKGEAA